MSSSSDFYHPDGGYSWIVLATIVLHSFAFSFIACNQGVMSDYYPQLFDEEQAKTNIISALAMGVFLFCSKFYLFFVFKKVIIKWFLSPSVCQELRTFINFISWWQTGNCNQSWLLLQRHIIDGAVGKVVTNRILCQSGKQQYSPINSTVTLFPSQKRG